MWGTLCDHSFSNTEAIAVCRQLGYYFPHAIARSSTTYGGGSGPIWVNGFSCSGVEKDLVSCRNSGWGYADCDHSEDVAVACSKLSNAIILCLCTYPPQNSMKAVRHHLYTLRTWHAEIYSRRQISGYTIAIIL